jgi:hypothetical protein
MRRDGLLMSPSSCHRLVSCLLRRTLDTSCSLVRLLYCAAFVLFMTFFFFFLAPYYIHPIVTRSTSPFIGDHLSDLSFYHSLAFTVCPLDLFGTDTRHRYSAQAPYLPRMGDLDLPGGSSPVITVAATAIAAAAVLALLRWALYPHRVKTIISPLRSVLPQLSSEQIAQLEYPPDIFPGARDVATPVSGVSFSCLPGSRLCGALI